MIVYVEYLKASTKLPELIRELSKFSGYKVKIQNFIVFLYIQGTIREWDLKKKLHLQQHQKPKYLETNFPKHKQYLYPENYKILLREIKENSNQWRPLFMNWKMQY